MDLFDLQASIVIATQLAENNLRQLTQRAESLGHSLQTVETVARATGQSMNNVLSQLEQESQASANAQHAKTQAIASGFMRAGSAVQGFGIGVQQVGSLVTNVGQSLVDYITKPAIAVGEAIIGTGRKFESALSTMSTYTHTTGSEFIKLKELAIEMGVKTHFSATEAAEAITTLSMAGMSTANIMGGGLKASLDLAAAGGMKLADAAELTITAMNSFKFENLQASNAADTLAGSANASAANLSDLQASLKYCAVSAGLLKFSFDDTNTAIALFSNHGLKGSSAGTALDNMLTRLEPKTKQARVAMESLGIITKDGTNLFINANGEIKNLSEITEVLTDKMGKLTTTERQKALQEIFNVRGARAAGILFQEGAAGVDKMSASIEKQSDIAEMARKRLDNFDGKLKLLKSSLETAAIVLYEVVAPAFNKVLDVLTWVVNAFTTAPRSIQWLIVGFVALLAAIGPVILVIGTLITAVGGVIIFIGGLVAAIGALVAAGPIVLAVIAALIVNFVYLSIILVPIIAIFGTISAVLASLGAVLVYIGQKTGFFSTAWAELKNVISILKDAFNDLYKVVEPALKAITQGLETFAVGALRYIFGINNIGVANKSFADTISKPAKFLKDFISEIKNFDKATMQTGTNGIPVMVSGADRLIQKFGNLGSLTVKIIEFVKELQNFDKITHAFGTNGVPYAVTGADRLREKFGRFGEITAKVIEFVKFMQDFNKTSVVFGRDNVPHMVTGMDRLKEKYPQLGKVIEKVKETWDDLKKWLDKNGEKMLNNIIKTVQDLADKLSKVKWKQVESDIKSIISIIDKLITGVKATTRTFDTLTAPIQKACVAIYKVFLWLYDVLLGHSIIPDIINGCVKWFRQLPSMLATLVSNAVTSVINGFTRMLNTTLSIAGSIVSGVGSRLRGIGSAISGAVGGAISAASNLMNSVKNTILGYASSAVSWGASIVNGIISGLGGVGGKIISTIKSQIPSSLLSFIPGFATGVRNFVGGLAVVGEKGPELVSLPSGSSVYTNEESSNMMKNAGRQVIINMYNPSFQDQQSVDPLMDRMVSRLKTVGVI